MPSFKLMLCVPGINDNPELWSSWPNEVCPMINILDGWKSQPFHYVTNEFTVDVDESGRSQTFADLIKAYPMAAVDMHIMAHSNGTRVSVSGIQLASVPINTLHLICGAIDADFGANGINALLSNGLVKKVFVYWGGQDQAMRLEHTIAGKLLFDLPEGHQPLGLSGPLNVNPSVADRVIVKEWPSFDHSTAFETVNLLGTVREVIANSQ
jgi:hypothetical protein